MIKKLLSLCISLGFAKLFRRTGDESGCVVLYYHGVKAAEAGRFRRQMEWLRDHCEIVSLRTCMEGRCRGPCVCITFDDALDNVRLHALPVLEQLEIPATVFAVPGNLGRVPGWNIPPHHPDCDEIISTPAQLRQYPVELIEIGSHTMSHPDLTRVDDEVLDFELRESKTKLEDMLGRAVNSLSIPFGKYDSRVVNAARRTGYEIIATCDPVVSVAGRAATVGRFKVSPNDWLAEFRLSATGAPAWRHRWQGFKNRVAWGARPATDGPVQAGLPQ